MSGDGAPTLPVPSAPGVRVAIVASRWHADVVDTLVERALATAAEAGAHADVIHVAGSVEIPLVAQALAAHADAVVALGLVVRGGTVHFDHVCRIVADGCARVALDTGIPVGNGVLMCEDMEQAWARSGQPGAPEDKGREAMIAALDSVMTLRALAARAQH